MRCLLARIRPFALAAGFGGSNLGVPASEAIGLLLGDRNAEVRTAVTD
jgi:hypothetical protein